MPIRNTEHGQISPRPSRLCPQSVSPPPPKKPVTVMSVIPHRPTNLSCPLPPPPPSALHHQPAGVGEKIRASAASGGTSSPEAGVVLLFLSWSCLTVDLRGCIICKRSTVTAYYCGPQRTGPHTAHPPPTHTLSGLGRRARNGTDHSEVGPWVSASQRH